MKNRLGYVSNSSSSSFIVCDDRPIEEVESFMKKLVEFYGESIFTEDDYYVQLIDSEFAENYRSSKWTEEPIVAGRVMVRSSSDNSIPSELFEILETKLNAFRIHHG